MEILAQSWLMLICVLMVELTARWEGKHWGKLPELKELSEKVIFMELGPLQEEPEPVTLPTPSPSPIPTPVPTELPEMLRPSPTPTPTPTPLPAPGPEPAPDFSGELYTRRTELKPDIPALLSEPLCQKLNIEGPQILIYHTHGTEAYKPCEGWEYTPTDEYRTTESSRNMIAVGEELKSALEARGFRVLHDTTLCDYPSYTGAYSRSELIIQRYLLEYPSISILLDVHRDAIGEGEDAVATEWVRADGTAAQVMLLAGTGEIGLEHPLWRENFKLALQIQGNMNAAYPGLARPIELVGERYNQQYTTGCLLLEVGSTGNTLPEALTAVRAFAESMADTLEGLERSEE